MQGALFFTLPAGVADGVARFAKETSRMAAHCVNFPVRNGRKKSDLQGFCLSDAGHCGHVHKKR